jgi:hypothetical protein
MKKTQPTTIALTMVLNLQNAQDMGNANTEKKEMLIMEMALTKWWLYY